MHDSQFPENPWYKTGGGIAFLGILGVLLAILLGFGGLVGYYAFQIRNGNGDQIQKDIQTARSSFSTDTKNTLEQTRPTVTDVTPYIRTANPQSGNLKSPITIIAFIDFECPYCQATYSTFAQVQKKYGDGVHIIFKHFPLETIHPRAISAALASSCAQEQQKFWEYHDLLFTQKDLSQEKLISYAETLGLNTSVFEQCLTSKRYRSQILRDIQDGVDLGVVGTPTYFIGTTRIEGSLPLDAWDKQIITAIQSHQ